MAAFAPSELASLQSSLKPPLRLAAVISSLQAGGAERVMAQLLNHWAEQGWEVTVLTFEARETQPFYRLHPAVRYRPLALASSSGNLVEAVRSNWFRSRRLRRELRCLKPQMVLAFGTQTNVLVLTATIGTTLPVIVSERSDPISDSVSKIWRMGRWLMYQRAQAVVAQTQSAAEFFRGSLGRAKLCVIPNPVTVPKALFLEKGRKRILAVGRLTREKGFERLIAAFQLVRQKHPDWTLRIVGQGSERAELVSQAKQLGLAETVEFPGLIKEIGREYAEADIFALSSRYEGFPNVLCEAMAAGLPVVAFNCRGGVREIISHGVDGLMVPAGDIGKMAEEISGLIESADRRGSLGAKAKGVALRYAPERVLAEWTRCLHNHIAINNESIC
jgi:glycosyltransferase involved in cell wall biosynthesis